VLGGQNIEHIFIWYFVYHSFSSDLYVVKMHFIYAVWSSVVDPNPNQDPRGQKCPTKIEKS
jgi:hypothetical protein